MFSQVGVVGLGLMGHGVAQVTAMSPEYSVVAFDGSQNAIDSGRKRISQSLSKMLDRKIQKGALSKGDAAAQTDGIMSRISFASDMSALADCDLVIEAITENPKIKLPLFEDLARITSPSCILASNTSSLSIMVGTVGRDWQACRRGEFNYHHPESLYSAENTQNILPFSGNGRGFGAPIARGRIALLQPGAGKSGVGGGKCRSNPRAQIR